MSHVVGIHCDNVPWTHDPNVAFVDMAGEELLVIEAERVTRKKYQGKELIFGDFSDPHRHLSAFLGSHGLTTVGVDAFAFVINANPYRFELSSYLEFLERLLGADRRGIHHLMDELLAGQTPRVANGICNRPTYLVRHHTAHSGYAWYSSPFDRAFVFAYDGGGFDVMTQIAHGTGRKLGAFENLPDQWFGFLYTRVTKNVLRYLTGSEPSYGAEGKAMALAGHGAPSYLARIRKFLTNAHALGGFDVSQESLRIYTDPLLFAPDCATYEGERRFAFAADYAASWQAYFEEAVLSTLEAHTHKVG